jgi:hypothetical protein
MLERLMVGASAASLASEELLLRTFNPPIVVLACLGDRPAAAILPAREGGR